MAYSSKDCGSLSLINMEDIERIEHTSYDTILPRQRDDQWKLARRDVCRPIFVEPAIQVLR